MLAGKAVRKVAIIGGNRIPFARSNSAYIDTSNQEMLTAALDGLVDRFKLHGEKIDEVAAGAVMKHARDFNLVRESVLGSKLAPETPAYDLCSKPAEPVWKRPFWWPTRSLWVRSTALSPAVWTPPRMRRWV